MATKTPKQAPATQLTIERAPPGTLGLVVVIDGCRHHLTPHSLGHLHAVLKEALR